MTVRLPVLCYWVIIGILACVASPSACCGRGRAYIKDNGYRDVLIAVGEGVPEDDRLIDSIMEVFTEASDLLYKVTR